MIVGGAGLQRLTSGGSGSVRRASEASRCPYDGFMHVHNHHRSHGALDWTSPIDTLTQLARDNLPTEHIQSRNVD